MAMNNPSDHLLQRLRSEGIERVWVNGVLSYTAKGRAPGARAGRFVTRAEAASGSE